MTKKQISEYAFFGLIALVIINFVSGGFLLKPFLEESQNASSEKVVSVAAEESAGFLPDFSKIAPSELSFFSPKYKSYSKKKKIVFWVRTISQISASLAHLALFVVVILEFGILLSLLFLFLPTIPFLFFNNLMMFSIAVFFCALVGAAFLYALVRLPKAKKPLLVYILAIAVSFLSHKALTSSILNGPMFSFSF